MTPDTGTAARPDRFERVPWAAVAVFIVLACGLAWLVALPLWQAADQASPSFQLLLSLLASAMMYTPAIAVVVVVFLLKAPRANRLRLLGMWPLRPAKRVLWFTGLALVAPAVIVWLVITLSAGFGWLQLDLISFSGYAETLHAQLPPGAADTLPPVWLLVALQLLLIPFAAIFNGLLAFGEEIGWRGWLLPALRPLGVWPAILITGVIWGLWHSPLILLGYNFGITDWRGVAFMTLGCVSWGALLGWSRFRSGSVWPAVFGHGALNASGGMVLLFSADVEGVNMALAGPLGLAAWIVIAIITIVLALTGSFRREPELSPASTVLG